MGKHRGSVAVMRDTVQFNVIGRGVHQVRDGKVTGSTWELELLRVKLLLGVTDADHKAVKVARQRAPGQADVVGTHGGGS